MSRACDQVEGGKVEKITLFIFGGVAQIEEEPSSPGRELLMASAGPGMSLLIAGVCFLGYVLTRLDRAMVGVVALCSTWRASICSWGSSTCCPGSRSMAGGCCGRSSGRSTGDILRATRWAARSGQVIGWGMVAIALFGVLGGATGFIWFGLVGWFIAWLAGASYRQQQLQSGGGGRHGGDAS